MNTIKLTIGNNVVPLRPDTIRLVQNGCSFHGLRSEDLNKHLKDFLKLVDSLNLDGDNRERTRLQDLALYDNKSWNDPRDFTKPVKAIALPQDVSSTSDRRLIELENEVTLDGSSSYSDTTYSSKAKADSSMEACKAEFTDHKMSEGTEEVESKEEVEEETEDEAEEEEKEGNPKHFETFPTMNELKYHEWLLKSPWPS
ncbi:hypothetical protein Tco_0941424 [Tanacetum coccineum]|uniref:MAK10-like protein n=1 Tax=Tanacetum coccineum TaxID=301880 RepID=A0ABQ5DXI2_9ASTR